MCRCRSRGVSLCGHSRFSTSSMPSGPNFFSYASCVMSFFLPCLLADFVLVCSAFAVVASRGFHTLIHGPLIIGAILYNPSAYSLRSNMTDLPILLILGTCTTPLRNTLHLPFTMKYTHHAASQFRYESSIPVYTCFKSNIVIFP